MRCICKDAADESMCLASERYLAAEAGVSKGMYYIGVAQAMGEGHLHGGPVWGALYVLVLLWRYDLHNSRIKGTEYAHDAIT